MKSGLGKVDGTLFPFHLPSTYPPVGGFVANRRGFVANFDVPPGVLSERPKTPIFGIRRHAGVRPPKKYGPRRAINALQWPRRSIWRSAHRTGVFEAEFLTPDFGVVFHPRNWDSLWVGGRVTGSTEATPDQKFFT